MVPVYGIRAVDAVDVDNLEDNDIFNLTGGPFGHHKKRMVLGRPYADEITRTVRRRMILGRSHPDEIPDPAGLQTCTI